MMISNFKQYKPFALKETLVKHTNKVLHRFELNYSQTRFYNDLVSPLRTSFSYKEGQNDRRIYFRALGSVNTRSNKAHVKKYRKTIAKEQAGQVWAYFCPASLFISLYSPPQSQDLITAKGISMYRYSTIQAFWSIQNRRACSMAIFMLPFFIPSFLATASRNSASNLSSITKLICPINICNASYLDIKLSLYLDNHKLYI